MLTNRVTAISIQSMELRSIDLLNGLLTAQSWAGSLRGFFMEEIWKDVVGYEGL